MTIPESGTIYVDTSIVIYSVETHAVYWPCLEPMWAAARDGNIAIASSELTLLESLVGPLRSGDATLAAAYEQIFTASELRLLPVVQPVLREAARLRATVPTLRTPDAIHAATALIADCDVFLTNDEDFCGIPGLSVLILRDVLAA